MSSKSTYEIIKLSAQIGVGIAISCAFFLLSLKDIKEVIAADFIAGMLVIILFVVSVIYFGMFIYVNVTSVETLEEHLTYAYVPQLQSKQFLLIFGAAVGLGTLIATCSSILYCSLTFLIFHVFVVLGDCNVMRALRIAIEKEVFENERRKKSVVAICDYWFLNPMLERGIILLFGYFVTFVLALLFRFTGQIIYNYCAYLLVIVNIVLGEIIVWGWRIERDRVLESLK